MAYREMQSQGEDRGNKRAKDDLSGLSTDFDF